MPTQYHRLGANRHLHRHAPPPSAPHNAAINTPSAAAVNASVHYKPVVPNCVAAHAPTGMRNAVIAVLPNIGGSVYPAPPIALSNTTSAPRNSCESAAIRR